MERCEPRLTPREVDLVYGLLQGKDIQELSRWLNVEYTGIKSQLTRLYAKYNVHAPHQLLAHVCTIQLKPHYLPVGYHCPQTANLDQG